MLVTIVVNYQAVLEDDGTIVAKAEAVEFTVKDGMYLFFIL